MPNLKTMLVGMLFAVSVGTAAEAARITELPGDNIGYDTERFALVIGNGNYDHIPDLDNTINDADAIAKSLQKVGFRVFHAQDMDRRGMNDAIEKFLAAVTPNSEAAIYYAGHGIELEGENYLLPTDIRKLSPSQTRTLRQESIGLNQLLADLESRKARVNLIMLDACRDNPFPKENTRSLGNTAGLGRVDPPHGTVVLYAAAAGEKALDKLNDEDPNPNGLFTRHLLELIEKPGLEIRPLIQELKERVYKQARATTLRTQRPSYYDGLIGKFYFRPKVAALTLKHPCEVLVNPAATRDEVLLADYASTVPLCRNAAAQYPDNVNYRMLLSVAEEQWAAQKALASNNVSVARAYVRLYEDGRYRKDVELHIARLDPSQAAPAAEPKATAQAPVQTAALGNSSRAVGTEETTPPASAIQPITPSVTPTEILVGRELARAMQVELDRLGCAPGSPDGIWGRNSRRALKAFAEHGSARLASFEPDMDVLETLRGVPGRICPLVCRPTEILSNGACVAKTCPAGQRLSSKGNCYTPSKRTVKKCAAGQKRNSKGVCYWPKKTVTKRTSTTTRKTNWQPPKKTNTYKKPAARKKTNRARRGVSGYNYRCEGAGPEFC